MKQIVQNLKSGETLLEKIPVPKVSSGSILIKSSRSLVSLGLENIFQNIFCPCGEGLKSYICPSK